MKTEKCLITITDKKLKFMIEADITDYKTESKWDCISDLVKQYCRPGQKLESIILFEDERITGGIRPGEKEAKNILKNHINEKCYGCFYHEINDDQCSNPPDMASCYNNSRWRPHDRCDGCVHENVDNIHIVCNKQIDNNKCIYFPQGDE